jgi:hypothetical protein
LATSSKGNSSVIEVEFMAETNLLGGG